LIIDLPNVGRILGKLKIIKDESQNKEEEIVFKEDMSKYEVIINEYEVIGAP
jgi:hypothetical protein